MAKITNDLMAIINILNYMGELSEYKNTSEFLYNSDHTTFNNSLPIFIKIGTASRKVSNRIIERYTKVPWKTMKDFINIYDSDCELLNRTVIHDLIENKLPCAVEVLEKIVSKELNEKNFSFKEYKTFSSSQLYNYVNFNRINANLLQLKIRDLFHENTWQRL